MTINDIKPYEFNAKIHDNKQIEALARIVKEVGWRQPVLVNQKGIIIVGHGRMLTWERHKHELKPVWIIDDAGNTIHGSPEATPMTPEQEMTYRLADNKLNESAWDFDLVRQDLKLLTDHYIDLTGFDRDIMIEPEEKDDVIPENVPVIAKLGDIWQLGKHRLMCGDSTILGDVEKLMAGQKARVCFTSPPYWLGFDYEQEKNLEQILTHIDKESELLSKFVEGKIIINTGNIASITKAEKITGKKQVALLVDWWQQALNKYNFYLRHIRIWAKTGQMHTRASNDSVDMHWEYMQTYTTEFETAGLIANFYNKAEKWYGQNKLGNWGKGWGNIRNLDRHQRQRARQRPRCSVSGSIGLAKFINVFRRGQFGL